MNTCHKIVKDALVLKDSACLRIFLRKRMNLMHYMSTCYMLHVKEVPLKLLLIVCIILYPSTGIKYDTDITGQTGNETKMFSLHFFR